MVTRRVVKRRYYNERKEIITCDFCGRDYDSRADIKRCMVCGKDVCLGCVISLSIPSRWWHQYEQWCCTSCWKMGKERRKILDEAEEVFEALVNKEFVAWRRDVGCDKDGK